jgi:PKD repeat protein
VYTAAGTYTVTLTATNADGSDKIAKQAITVTINCGNDQSLVTSAGETVGCVALPNDATDLSVKFTGSASDPLAKADWVWKYSAGSIPTDSSGLPDPIQFPYAHTFEASELSYTFPGVDISEAVSSDIGYIYISAHASTLSGKDAWVLSDTFVDGNGAWARYFDYFT